MSQQSNIASGDSAPSQDSEINNDNQNVLESDNENKSENRASEPTTRTRRRQLDNIITAEQREVQGMALDSLAIRLRQQFQRFLEEYKDSDEKLYYVEQLKTMQSDQSLTLVVNWLHWRPEEQSEHSQYQDMADMIQSEYYRFEPYLRQGVQNFVRSHIPDYVQNIDLNVENKGFSISIMNFPDISALRDLKTSKIGQLCSVSGTVTRTSEVRPELLFGTFLCMECGNIEKYVKQQFKYTEPQVCTNSQCQNRRKWTLDVERSKFVDWQKARIQENSYDIPAGSMPRSIDVILRGECVETCKPGDNATFTGTLIVVPDVGQFYSRGSVMFRSSQSVGPSEGVTGIKALGVRELNYKLVFLANHVSFSHKQLGQSDIRGDEEEKKITETLTESERADIIQMAQSSQLYDRLAKSIAPNIFGHMDIKKGILLMLFGGLHKQTKDGVNLRGDINICIVGDPSTAKSQFLKYITRILPRTIYTSGKASTAAGLTAAVMKDPETGEFGVEAGALMLADNGICCIDEFDKMDAFDQTAIHEAMEQQTITITKAGIHATLNARASILAAANPLFGRYDTRKPLKWNVNISAPIMSRFDLFFVILDECDDTTDCYVANHIVQLHKTGQAPSLEPHFTTEQIQRYVRVARAIKPTITPEARKALVRCYRQLRQQDQSEQKAYRFTVRQLESLIRLSEAIARCAFQNNVTEGHVEEACRLLRQSIISVDSSDVTFQQPLSGEAQQDANGDVQMKDKTNQNTSIAQHVETETINVSMTFYTHTARLIVHHIHKNNGMGLKQSKIEELLLEERQEYINGDMEKLMHEHKLFRFIIRRLVTTDHILLVKTPAEREEDRVLIVHPNYDPDSGNTSNLDDIYQS